jgi:hypothetical protein
MQRQAREAECAALSARRVGCRRSRQRLDRDSVRLGRVELGNNVGIPAARAADKRHHGGGTERDERHVTRRRESQRIIGEQLDFAHQVVVADRNLGAAGPNGAEAARRALALGVGVRGAGLRRRRQRQTRPSLAHL